MVEKIDEIQAQSTDAETVQEERKFLSEDLAQKEFSSAAMLADLDAKINAFTDQMNQINKAIVNKLLDIHEFKDLALYEN